MGRETQTVGCGFPQLSYSSRISPTDFYVKQNIDELMMLCKCCLFFFSLTVIQQKIFVNPNIGTTDFIPLCPYKGFPACLMLTGYKMHGHVHNTDIPQ